MRGLYVLCALVAAFGVTAQYRETITVARILFDVRVTRLDGEPVTDLAPGDFEVTIGGKNAVVESAEWIADDPAAVDPESGAPRPNGRLFVIFIQTDFAREQPRISGQLDFLRYAEKMVESFAPEDRVAVFSFDSHLKFRLDFTSDTSAIQEAMREAVLIDEPHPPPVVPNPSLARRLDAGEMRRAKNSETALLIIGNALRNIEGPKSLLLMGWGLGERRGGMVKMNRYYALARNVLEAARVSVFALDTTHAGYHDLQVGLAQAAEDTGGFYAKTSVFPQLAVDRLQRTLSGHYELEVRRPDELKPGTHELRVRVKRRGVEVLAPTSWMDRH